MSNAYPWIHIFVITIPQYSISSCRVYLCWHSAFCSKQSVVLQNAPSLELTKYKRHVVNEKSFPTCKCPVVEMAKERRARVWLTRCSLEYSVRWQDAHRRLNEPCVCYFPRCKRTSGGNGKREKERIKMPLWTAFTFSDGIANVAESTKLMYCIRMHSLIQMTTIYSSYLVYVILHYLVTAAARLQRDKWLPSIDIKTCMTYHTAWLPCPQHYISLVKQV